jgi:hypothetical protein
MQRLQLQLTERQDWYQFVDKSSGDVVVFCPTDSPPPAGSSVLLDVQFAGGTRIFLKGVVMWRRSKASAGRGIQPGAGVRIRKADEAKVDYLGGYVRGGLLDKRRGLRRLPIRLQVTYSCASGRRMNFTRDLHEEGLSLNCSELLSLGSTVLLELIFPKGLGAYRLRGKVVRHVKDDAGNGMGIQLLFEDSTQQENYVTTLHRLEEMLLEGGLPAELLH